MERRAALSARRAARAAGLALAVVALAPAGAAAADLGLAVSTGIYEPLEERFLGAEAGFELWLPPQPLRRLLPAPARDLGLVPIAGVMVTGERSVYGYLGARRDFRLRGPWLGTLSWAAGAYKVNDGKDLGHGVQFRTGVELAYQLRDGSRLGVLLYHLSNGGLGDNNPGSESLVLTYGRALRSGDWTLAPAGRRRAHRR